jgi:alkanesulfonate monooxygenase SsuD/methylene tetrahydromethanopterin reductase-like flavin-dependent oxidoreductase (luciferase family)
MSPSDAPVRAVERAARNDNVRFSVFSLVDHHPEYRTIRQLYSDVGSVAQCADELGFYAMFVAEHHFCNVGVCPNPAVLLAHLAGRTKSIRLGPAVSVIPLRDPRIVAEDYMLLDLLSGGRGILGVGPGSFEFEFKGLEIDHALRRERFDEALAMLRQAVTGAGINHRGHYFAAENVTINVPPREGDPMPIYVAALSEGSAYKAGRQGYSLLNTPFISMKHGSEMVPVLKMHRTGLAEAGIAQSDRDAAVLIHCHVAPDEETALRKVDQPFGAYIRERTPKRTPLQMREAGMGLFGTPKRVAEDISALVGLGANHIILFVNFGGMPIADAIESLTLFSHEVAPKVLELARRRQHAA